MNNFEVADLLNSRHYLILSDGDVGLPSKEMDKNRRKQLSKLRELFPYVIHKENRESDNLKLSKWNALFTGSDYSFMKRKDGKIYWVDYSINMVSLLLGIMRLQPSVNFTELVDQFCLRLEGDSDNKLSIDWNNLMLFFEETKLPDFYSRLAHPKINFVDLIDRFYDEIKITHLHPAAYHQLFHWFGEAAIEMGYHAFDEFNKHRDSKLAWEKVIKEHLDTYNLEEGINSILLQEKFYSSLRFV